MSADPYMERVQRRVLDLAAEVSWRDARLAEVHAAGRIDWATYDDWDFDFEDCSLVGDWLAEPESTPIYDALVMEQLAASSSRPSLWQRTPEWALWLGTGILVLALLALPVIA